jgi:four helix bundle protein
VDEQWEWGAGSWQLAVGSLWISVASCNGNNLLMIKNCEDGRFQGFDSYKKAFNLSMDIFKITRSFPQEEQYSLSAQIIRSSRSVCAAIGEAYRKRRYKAHFISKLSDADMENAETNVWLDFALACGYLTKDQCKEFRNCTDEIGKLLHFMMGNPEKFSGNKITTNFKLPTAN